MKFRRFFAFALTAALAVSFAGCGNNKADEGSETAGKSVSAQSDQEEQESQVSLPQLDADPEIKESIEKKIDMDKLGPLTKFAVSMLENKNLTVKFDVNQIKDDDASEASKSGSAMNLESLGEEITVAIIKNENKDYRIKLDIGMFSFDMLKNKDGLFSVNPKVRSYSVLKTAEEMNKADSGASSDSSAEAQKAIDSVKDMTGGMLDNFDTNSLINDTSEKEVTYNGDGTETYDGEEYKYESYTVKKKAKAESSAASGSASETKEETVQVKVYFGDDNMMKIIHVEKEDQKYDFIFKTFSVEVDEEDLTIPSEYTEKEASEIDLSALGISIPSKS